LLLFSTRTWHSSTSSTVTGTATANSARCGTPRIRTALPCWLAVTVAQRLGSRPTASRHPATTRLVGPVAGGLRLGSRGAPTLLSAAVETSPPRHQGVTVRRGGEEVRRDGCVDEATAASSRRRSSWRRRIRIRCFRSRYGCGHRLIHRVVSGWVPLQLGRVWFAANPIAQN
jgi:hypothetical protein